VTQNGNVDCAPALYDQRKKKKDERFVDLPSILNDPLVLMMEVGPIEYDPSAAEQRAKQSKSSTPSTTRKTEGAAGDCRDYHAIVPKATKKG
jgi:hypothetical protein